MTSRRDLERWDRQRKAETKDKIRAQRWICHLIEAGPVGRTSASIADEEGWTQAEARRAVAAAQAERGDSITYAPESRTFFWMA